MDKMKMRLTDAVAARLSAAPRSTAKDELVEELSDNLYRRFLDMTSAGLDDETAFRRAMEDLGDVDELLRYLGAESDGGVHGGYQAVQNDLDAILADISEACNTAVDQARDLLIQARDAIRRRTTVQRDSGRVRVRFNTRPNGPDAAPDRSDPPGASESSDDGRGWEFEAEVAPGEGRFFAGGGPREREDVVYGFGYDKARGGFFARWGKPRDDSKEARGPHPDHQDDGSCSVAALRDLRGIEVFTAAGDVTIHVSEAPDAGVVIDGDVNELDVTCSADGVLTIREGRTASSSFFSRRGFCSADVELFLPRRRWEAVSVTTSSGDVKIDRDGLDVDRLTVKTASGDLEACLRSCARLSFKSGSGDLDLSGTCADLRAETMSGDIDLRGQVEGAVLSSASGDIDLAGSVSRFQGSSLSGDVRLETSRLPQSMEMSSKSGDCEARLPDKGPFTLRFKTVTGSADFAFPFQYDGRAAIYGDGAGPAYTMTTVSGDIKVFRTFS